MLLDDQRSALSTVLVLQEMGLTVDVAADRDAAVAWARMARYAVIVRGGASVEQLVEFALKVRATSPFTQILLLGHFGAMPELAALDVHVLRPLVNGEHARGAAATARCVAPRAGARVLAGVRGRW